MHNPGKFCIRMLLGVLVILCVWSLFTVASAAEPSEDTTYVCTVYHKPRQSAAVIGCLPDGAELTVKGCKDGFCQIDCGGSDGYIPISQVVLNGVYRVRCEENSEYTKALICLDSDALTSFQTQILQIAKNQLGIPYVYGGASRGGFDCSGLMLYLYDKMQISLHRCADEQLQDGIIVPKEDMQVGDLVYFRKPRSPYLATHVGIYIGDGRFIHSGSGGVGIAKLSDAYFESTYIASRRIVLEKPPAPEAPLSPPTGRYFYSGLRPDELPVPAVIFQEKGKPLMELTFSLLPQTEAVPLLSPDPYF